MKQTVVPPTDRRSAGRAMAWPSSMPDPFRRLRGEPPLDGAAAEDARVWAGAYRQMLAFGDRLVGLAQSGLRAVTEEAARREIQSQVTVLEAERDRVARRLRLWEHRAAELAEPEDSRSAAPGLVTAGR